MDKIPVSVLITTKNEEAHIAECLRTLKDFAQVIVIDSHSTDQTAQLAQQEGAELVLYEWNGRYPKKRGWCLENLDIMYDWVLWIDADERMTPRLSSELRNLFENGIPENMAGYFIQGQYIWNGRALRYGLRNNKIALFHRERMMFPVVDDLHIEGMGEIEGHYQPVLKSPSEKYKVGQLSAPVLHDAYASQKLWDMRHERYAKWEAKMTFYNSWPKDPVPWREVIKQNLRASWLRPTLIFLYSYIWKRGFLDGRAGFTFAQSRKDYAVMVHQQLRICGF